MSFHPYIVLNNVRIAYGDETVFDNLSFTVRSGEFLCLLGPSGCGKSTTLRLMSGLLKPHEGNILVGGREPDAAADDFSFVFQSPRLVSWRNALRNVTLASELRNGSGSRKANEARAAALLSMVGLSNEKLKRASDLSGGERQRVAIARAVVRPRSLVLADEPTGALDSLTGDSIIELLASLPESTGAAVVLVTHEPRYASWAERVVFLRDGVIVDESAPILAAVPSAAAVTI